MSEHPIDLAALRERLAQPGRRSWRSLDAVADTEEVRAFLRAEFPSLEAPAGGADRRHFLKLMAASLALAGLAACDDSDGHDEAVPYVRQPENSEPGVGMSYASAAVLDGVANGILVTTRDGRPIKIEGNPQHPWSRRGTDVFAQASILDLYDPMRSQSVQYLGRIASWLPFRAAMASRFALLRAQGGQGLRLLTGKVSSPSLIAQIGAMQHAFPQMHWHSHSAVDGAAADTATEAAFGRPLQTRWRFDRARVVVALDGDFLDPGPHQVGVTRDWTEARRASAQSGALLELHAATAMPNLTSAKADFHVAATPDAQARIAAWLLRALSEDADAVPGPPDTSPIGAWQTRAARALRGARGQSIVLAGATASAAVQESVHRLNAMLGNTGETVFYTAPTTAAAESLPALVAAMDAGAVSVLLMLGTNPAYDAPADLHFADRVQRVPLKLHAGLYADETATLSDWHLPLSHPLEAWGDARAFDGTVSLMQPTVAPFYDSRTAQEILSLLTDAQPQAGLDLLQAYYAPWFKAATPAAFAVQWRQALIDGFLPGTALAAEPVALAAAQPEPAAAPPTPGLTVLFRPDPTVWDGAPANNGWLQELPKPLTKLVWDNAISVAPALAEQHHLAQGDVVTLTVNGRSIDGAIWILPGQAEATVAVSLGYGRATPGMLFSGLGYNAYALRSAGAPWQLSGATLRATGRRRTFATTQTHNTMEGHDFVRVQAIGAAPVGDAAGPQPSFYPPQQGDGRAWGMVIDTDACTGCNACVVACQAENNIPVVGAEQVRAGREMHWLRIDRYYAGGLDEPDTHFMPVPCMHCEQAPCEVACPVEATLHDHEGLNLQVYNRCIGTRACSSYCPYKVRRFNYLDYAGDAPPSLQARANPEVTVRARGVMEKCTYCVQRVAAARIDADRGDGVIADGTVQTACQAACPSQAISFGDLNDSNSAVAAARRDPRNYALLGELNLRPRTTYLAEWSPAADPSHG